MLTVLIATRNGARTLSRTLAHLAEAQAAGLDWELIVVDNGSTDPTVEVVRAFEQALPLRLFTSSPRGKNRALNHGLEYVRGDLVVLTDDDILPERNWLLAIRARAERHPNVDLFGGPILPEWEREPPPWLESAVPFGVAFGLTPPGLADGPVDPGRIWGGNMFVRRRVFERGLRFDENRGPGAGHYVMGGETEFTVRAAAVGHASWWCPEVRVHHIIRAEQLERRWLFKRAYRHGKSVYVGTGNNRTAHTSGAFLLGFPRYLIRQAAGATMRAAAREFVQDRAGAVRHWWQFFHLSGYMAQARSNAGRCQPGRKAAI